MPILEFEPSDELLAICEHAFRAEEEREGFRDTGQGAGLLLCADCVRGVYLMSNASPMLIAETGHEMIACAVGANPECDSDWGKILAEITSGSADEDLLPPWPVDWARIIRHQIRQKTGRIRILSTYDELEMLYETAVGGIPHKRK
jgi:hypothetical protein